MVSMLPHRLIILLAMLGLSWSSCAEAEVKLNGVDSKLDANIRAHLRLEAEPCDASEDQVRYRYGRAESQIRAALRPFGYYSPDIQSSLEFPSDACWRAVFTIDPGEPVRLTRVDVRVDGPGADEPFFRKILGDTGLSPGAQLDHATYDSVKTQLSVTARENGYFEAEFTSSVLRVDPADRTAEVELVLETGPRYRFGTLTIESATLDTDFIRRYLEFSEGAPYEQRAIRKLQSDLTRGEYFRTIDVVPTRNPNRTVDLLVKLTEGRRIRYGVGLGYGTDTGPVVSGNWIDRWVNRRGHRLELDAMVSEVASSFTADYRIPSRHPQREWYSIYGGYEWRNTDAVQSKTRKVGVREERFHNSHWRSSRFVEYSIEDYRQDQDWQERYTLVPGYTLTFQASNATDRPTKGIRLGAEVMGASEAVLSGVSFARLRVFGKTILPVTERGRLLLRGESGWMETSNFDKVPPTYRFFAGGDASVRGYQYQSLGPVDSQGNALGGERVVTGSVEMDWKVTQTWSVAVFSDAGNVGNDNLLKDLPWSVGTGVRWYSPLGPIRVDVAFPQEGDDTWRLHISMGPDL